MAGRTVRKDSSKLKLNGVDVKPELMPNPFYANESKSKIIKIHMEGESADDCLIGYYDFSIGSFISFRSAGRISMAKVKLAESDISGWRYV